MAESKIWEFNKGEWSEAYVFLKLLAEGRIYGADSKEEKNLSTYIDILNLLKFEKNKTFDGKTSYVATYTGSGESANTYVFPNIAPLITTCINEKKEGKQDPDWNKVVLIPVLAEIDSNNNITSIRSNLNMESACLVGGEKNPIKMQILYTTF